MPVRQYVLSLVICAFSTQLFSKTCNSLKVSGSDQWHPIAYQEDGTAKGIGYDVSRLIASELALPIHIDTSLSWAQATKKLRAGKIDIMAGVYWTQERVRDFYLSEAFTKDTLNIYVNKGQEFPYSRLKDLIGKKTDILKGSSNGEAFDNFARIYLDKSSFNSVNSFKDLFIKLNDNDIDYAILDPFTTKKILKELNLEDSVVSLEQPLEVNPVHLMVSKKSPCAKYISQINNIITNFEMNGRLKKLHNKYLNFLKQ